MKRAAVAAWIMIGTQAIAQDASHCVAINDPNDRLNCFDQAFIDTAATAASEKPSGDCSGFTDSDMKRGCEMAGSLPRISEETSWHVREERSKLDDSRSVFISTESKEYLKDRFGSSDRAMLFIRCKENTTSAFITFAGHFMSDIQGYGRVDYRVDGRKASRSTMDASTDNKALGLWSGRKSIPFAKNLFDGSELYVRATPYSESAIEMTFPIDGLKEAITPLRDACNW